MILPADSVICPLCKGELYLCEAEHTDGPSARLHCRNASMHNFPTDPGSSPSRSDVENTASTNTHTTHEASIR